MGCCFSTNHPQKPNPDLLSPDHHHHHFSKSATNGGSFPPLRPSPPPEEETVVKEVLSETPIPKPPTSILIQPNNNKKEPEIEELKIEPTAVIKPTTEEIISEVSEMYSFSESYSTTTVTEMKDDDGEVTQIVKPPARVPRKRPERGHRSPARRPAPAPSPEKRSRISTRSVQSRTTTTTTTTQRRNVGPPNGIRREPAGGSCRRSRSPVTRGEAASSGVARHESPMANNAGRNGDRTPEGSSENNGKLRKGKDEVSPAPATGECESLENPLVSFECFIFL